MTIQSDLDNRYFDWMYNLVCNDNYYNISFRKLLITLYNIEFTYIIDRDGNRASDGIGFRYRFGIENRYPKQDIERYLDTRPCSVLEMMISLAFRIEEEITDDPDYGNRTGQWFWNMITSLGLGTMVDKNFDRRYVEDVIFRFLNRQYEPNGKGGLFTVERDCDMRTAEIWYQAMWYLDENIECEID